MAVIIDRIIETLGKLDKDDTTGDWMFDLAKSRPDLFIMLLCKLLPSEHITNLNITGQINPVKGMLTDDDEPGRM